MSMPTHPQLDLLILKVKKNSIPKLQYKFKIHWSCITDEDRTIRSSAYAKSPANSPPT